MSPSQEIITAYMDANVHLCTVQQCHFHQSNLCNELIIFIPRSWKFIRSRTDTADGGTQGNNEVITIGSISSRTCQYHNESFRVDKRQGSSFSTCFFKLAEFIQRCTEQGSSDNSLIAESQCSFFPKPNEYHKTNINLTKYKWHVLWRQAKMLQKNFKSEGAELNSGQVCSF